MKYEIMSLMITALVLCSADNSTALQDIVVGTPGENVDGWGEQGRAYVFDGTTGALKFTLDTPNLQSDAYFGVSVSSGDANGDGIDDIIVGAPGEDQGRVYVFNGATGALMRTINTPNPQAYAYFGDSVSSGDANGDSISDIIVGDPYEDVVGHDFLNNADQGRVYVFNGATGALMHTLNTPNPQADALFGWSVSSGDANGDGIRDIIVGACEENVGDKLNQGRAYVFNGATGALIYTLNTPNPQYNAAFGWSVGSGDVNGDGKDDIIVGAPNEYAGGNTDQGRAYVFNGATGALIYTLNTPNPEAYAHFGDSVSSGDANGDGISDIIVGAPREDVGGNVAQGRVYVFNGATGALMRTLTTPNPQAYAYFGSSVSSGDVNGDGKDDIIVGSPQESVSANANQGRVYVFNGATGALMRTINTPNPQSNTFFGSSVSSGRIIVEDKIGLFRPSEKKWYLDHDNSGGSDYRVVWGDSTDIPVTGDWDGDDYDEIGIFRPSEKKWYLNYDNSGTSEYKVVWGESTDKPVTGDWDGDGYDEIGLFRPSTGTWYLDRENNGKSDYVVKWGSSSDIPVTGDWDNDGYDEIGLFRPSTKTWYLDYDNNGASDYQVVWGDSTDIPLTGDWDGDGYDEIGLFRPSTAKWYLDYDNNGASDYSVTWGASTDKPVTGKWT